MTRRQEVSQEDRVEKNVTIQHYESIAKESSCRPEGVHAVRFSVTGVLNVGNVVPTSGPHAVGLTANHYGDIVHPDQAEGANLSLEEGHSSQLDQTLGLVASRAVES
jgi:hypothetical protein